MKEKVIFIITLFIFVGLRAQHCVSAQQLKFKVTLTMHGETEDLAQVVEKECGPDYRVADWQDVADNKGNIEQFIKKMKWGEGFIVVNNGQHFWGNSSRHYFIERHDHKLPTSYTFLSHDNIDNHRIDLGSWYNLKMRVLCVRRTTLIETSKFKVTLNKHSEKEDLGQTVKNECGADYRIADWQDVVASKDVFKQFAQHIGMKWGDGIIVTNDGNHFWNKVDSGSGLAI